MTTEEKFNAAVNVIRSLPKNGSYQPSYDLMLRFYAYFKQATQGPCSGSRPAFWDVVGKAKYDAWKRLGDMPKADAMKKYVDELHSIVETMSYSDKVASFLDAPNGELDNIKAEDLQLVIGDVIERVMSQPNSPLASRENSPSRLISSISSSRSVSPVRNDDSDHSDGEYVDTIETLEPRKQIPNGNIPNEHVPSPQSSHKSRAKVRSATVQQPTTTDISQEITRTVQNLKADVDRLSDKLTVVEKSVAVAKKRTGLFGVPTSLLIFVVVWPFVANAITRRIRRRHF